MNRNFFRILIIILFGFTALGIGALVLFPGPWNSLSSRKTSEVTQGRVIIPQSLTQYSEDNNPAEQIVRNEQMTLKLPLEDGEILVTLLNYDFNGDMVDEQIVAYRNLLENESPIYLGFFDYDHASGAYKRVWTDSTAATRPGTISLYAQDLIGDRGACILLSGMNGQGEHTLTIFRKTSPQEAGLSENLPFVKIAEFQIDGSIMVSELERSQAYQMGMARGQSFPIIAYGRDQESSNMMDRIELTYIYNENSGLYEQDRLTRIPGTQIEQQRVRELLGNTRAFEEFISGLWYYVSSQGTVDHRQYIYFDPDSKEIIFYEDETQQVFNWQNSNITRYGLYISSQNISVTTLRRSIDIELESLDSIRVKVYEDVRLPVRPVAGVNAPLDGSYRKAGTPEYYAVQPASHRTSYISAVYDSPMGKIQFFNDGNYELNYGVTARQGKYAFFYLDDQELLELRSIEGRTAEAQNVFTNREIYLVESVIDDETAEDETESPVNTDSSSREKLILSRIYLGARGIQPLHEGPIALNLVRE